MRLQLPFSLIGTVKLNKSRWKCTAVHYAWFSQFDIIPFGSDWNTIGKINFGKCLFEFILNTVLYFASLVIQTTLVIHKRRSLPKIQRNRDIAFCLRWMKIFNLTSDMVFKIIKGLWLFVFEIGGLYNTGMRFKYSNWLEFCASKHGSRFVKWQLCWRRTLKL